MQCVCVCAWASTTSFQGEINTGPLVPADCCQCLFPYWTFPDCHLYIASGTGASLKRHNGHYKTLEQRKSERSTGPRRGYLRTEDRVIWVNLSIQLQPHIAVVLFLSLRTTAARVST